MTKYRGIRVHHKMTLGERLAFYSTPDPATGCRLWHGANKGKRTPYGVLFYKGKKKGAHIWAWENANGRTVPDGMIVRHSCDTPPCIEETHLLLGDQKDNAGDREERGRGRQPKGEASGRAKLTEAQVIAIRADPRGKRPVAREYGVSPFLIQCIRQRRNWKHI